MEEDDDPPPEGAPAWMATFADMSTLLLTFFVLLLSFANMDIEDFKMALGSVREALGVASKTPGNFEGRTSSPVSWPDEVAGTAQERGAMGDQETIAQIETILKEKKEAHRIVVEVTENNIILRVTGLFDSNQATIAPTEFKDLSVVAEVCRRFPGPISVEGHTDPRPLARSHPLVSNWGLSAARAAAVAAYLIEVEGLDASSMTVAGYGSLRPVEAPPESTVSSEDLLRRIDVILTRRKPVATQPTDTNAWRPHRRPPG